MSNNYCQFSTELEIKTEEEKSWWERHLAIDNESSIDEEGKEVDSDEARVFNSVVDTDCDSFYQFEYKIEYTSVDKSVWFYAEENGNTDHVVRLVHKFFKAMRPDGNDVFRLFWACSSNQTQLDAFFGGTEVATKEGVGSCGTDEQVEYAKSHIVPVE